jgi:hypothetical protein
MIKPAASDATTTAPASGAIALAEPRPDVAPDATLF